MNYFIYVSQTVVPLTQVSIWSSRWDKNDSAPNEAIAAEMDLRPIGLQRSYGNDFPEVVVIVTKV